MRGLYLHIPFCSQKCHYCSFVITLRRHEPERRRFLDALEKEASQARSRYGRLKFDTVYFGGGTPSLLNPEELSRIFELIHREFHIAPDAEISFELNPDDADAGKLAVCRKLGINRISLGAQAFQPALLESLGRKHSAAQIETAAILLKQAGFENINADLIIRLPLQEIEDVRESVLKAVSLGAAQVTLYDLEVHERTAFGNRSRRGLLNLPDDEVHESLFEAAEGLLIQNGYLPYELFSFAKPGFECLHNMIYWKGYEYLGLGPGAYSFMEKTRYQFASDVNRYLKKCGQQDWSRDFEELLTAETWQMEKLITGLRLPEGILIEDIRNAAAALEPKIAFFAEGQLLEHLGGRLLLTPRGRRLAETVISGLVQRQCD